MSYQLRAPHPPGSNAGSSGSESDADEDDNISDWASSLGDARRTKSLFDSTILNSPEEALRHDSESHHFSLENECRRLGLDTYERMRLINYIRKENATPEQVGRLGKEDEIWEDDAFLKPVISDDPLLQLDLDDSWTDDEDDFVPTASGSKSASDRIAMLEAELARTQAELAIVQNLVRSSLTDEPSVPEDLHIAGPGTSIGKGKGKEKIRDDDSHYFDSYAENDIHEVMLKDTTRTMSYAKFILSNPIIFKDATVLDVGCGTGILSMLAARAGAKKVYAVEASGLAGKTRENIRLNGLGDVIEVIQAKVEDIDLPEKVDVIISEWMGYMLLYESMLDSVLSARDRFLKPTGLMAPSQTRLMICGITGERVWKERVEFWKSVYGFDMSPMDPPCFADGLVEIIPQDEIVTSEAVVRDINNHTATPRSLDFHSAFTLTPKSSSPTRIRAFLTWFDTFFSPGPGEASQIPLDGEVQLTRFAEDDYERPVVPSTTEGGCAVSFTTGPRGRNTHWKQVTFLLRNELVLQSGERIEGRFYCRKSAENSRELNVEVHFAKVGAEGVDEGTTFTVQTYKVR